MPGSPTIEEIDTQATSLTVKWTAPADDGASPITAFRMVILEGGTEIKNVNITDPGATRLSTGGLQRDTEYTVRVFARNAVFEGPAVEKAAKTKYEGNKMEYLDPRIVLPIRSLLGAESSSTDVNDFKLVIKDLSWYAKDSHLKFSPKRDLITRLRGITTEFSGFFFTRSLLLVLDFNMSILVYFEKETMKNKTLNCNSR